MLVSRRIFVPCGADFFTEKSIHRRETADPKPDPEANAHRLRTDLDVYVRNGVR